MVLRLLLTFFLLTTCLREYAQNDSSSLKMIISRALTLAPDKADSILYFAQYIAAVSDRTNFTFGKLQAIRLRGFYYDYKEQFDSAIYFYQQYARAAERANKRRMEMDAGTDIGMVYMETGQYLLAKQMYNKCLLLAEQLNMESNVSAGFYNNLGFIYAKLNNIDSAYYFHNKSFEIKAAANDSFGLAYSKTNLIPLLLNKGLYEKALQFARENLSLHKNNNKPDGIWYDYLNLGKINSRTNNFKEAEKYYQLSYDLAMKLEFKAKQVESLTNFADLYKQMGNFEKAYSYKIRADSINSLLATNTTNLKIAELQEKYKAELRDHQNAILLAKLDRETLQHKTVSIIAIGLLMIAIISSVAWFLINKKKNILASQNVLINNQKTKLTVLNQEINSLIAIVSHDLKTPLANLKLWAGMLSQTADKNNKQQLDAIGFVHKCVDYSLTLINNILKVESAKIRDHQLNFEQIDLGSCVHEIVDQFKPASESKKIVIHSEINPANISLFTDELLLKRIIENLLSNAIKYSPIGSNVWVNITEAHDQVRLSIKDEGPGIATHERDLLFTKYGKLKNLPTGEETSTGLGLHIVKRIGDELNAKIELISAPGEGASFVVSFKNTQQGS